MGDSYAPPSSGTETRPKVAVIGSGLAGLTTAYLLSEAGLDVWLIEKVGGAEPSMGGRLPNVARVVTLPI